MENKYVYLFSEGNASMRNLLGGKGANLAEMTNLGIPVPQGFTVTTEACNKYYADGKKISQEVLEQIESSIKELEKITGKEFGSNEDPLLVSVRSGARASMPGMMDTILNLGLNDEAVEIVAKKTSNPRFAYDSYRRFIQMFSDVVMGIEKRLFEDKLDEMKEEKGYKVDTDLTAEDLKELVGQFKEIYKKEKGEPFPQDPKVQLIESVTAVFRSWDNPRAIVYRRLNDIPGEWGTAALGTYRCGLMDIDQAAFVRNFVCVPFAQIKVNGQAVSTEYGDMTAPRSLKYVGQRVQADSSAYSKLNETEKAAIDAYAAAE